MDRNRGATDTWLQFLHGTRRLTTHGHAPCTHELDGAQDVEIASEKEAAPMATIAKNERAAQPVPVRMYETSTRVMIAAPMPGLEPRDIEVTIEPKRVVMHGHERGPHQYDMRVLLAEWAVGNYHREVDLPSGVAAELTNATYDNGVLVVSMPKLQPGQAPTRATLRLDAVAATRGEHVGHVGRDVTPDSTREHRVGKHKVDHDAPPADPGSVTPPAK
jgi:HSP20 family protein